VGEGTQARGTREGWGWKEVRQQKTIEALEQPSGADSGDSIHVYVKPRGEPGF
jgi:hypothetical protein